MDIKIILEAMKMAFSDENLNNVFIFLIATIGLYTMNIVLGTYVGTKKESFITKKFFMGIEKMVVVSFIIFCSCYFINLFTIGLNNINGININTEFVSVLEIIGIIVAVDIDLAKDIVDKVKSIFTLKFISYDDVQVTVNPDPSVYEEGIG